MPNIKQGDEWMFGQRTTKRKERPLPPLPHGWPTKGNKVHIHPEGYRILTHPQRESLVCCMKRYAWVLPSEINKRIKK